jgi:tetratricopeptide (TPR) repeat protein
VGHDRAGGRPAGERGGPRRVEPALPDRIDLSLLDRETRAELRSLSKPNAEVVGGHLIEAGLALESDPRRALEHARAARGRASRLAAVREAVGVCAYHAQEWSEAITELRTARRISGDPRTLPLIADCERALGRPQQALRALTDPDVGRLDPQTRAELYIVVAGARRDLGQLDAALAVLARGGLDREHPKPGALRLWYAYADTLEEAGRTAEAATWFAAAAGLDAEGETDAVDRAAALL